MYKIVSELLTHISVIQKLLNTVQYLFIVLFVFRLTKYSQNTVSQSYLG